MESENDTLDQTIRQILLRRFISPDDGKVSLASMQKVVDGFNELTEATKREYANSDFINPLLDGMERSVNFAPEEDQPSMKKLIIQFRETIDDYKDVDEEIMTFDDVNEIIGEFDDASLGIIGETLGFGIHGNGDYLFLDLKETLWDSEEGWNAEGMELSKDFTEALCQKLNDFANTLLKTVDAVRAEKGEEESIGEDNKPSPVEVIDAIYNLMKNGPMSVSFETIDSLFYALKALPEERVTQYAADSVFVTTLKACIHRVLLGPDRGKMEELLTTMESPLWKTYFTDPESARHTPAIPLMERSTSSTRQPKRKESVMDDRGEREFLLNELAGTGGIIQLARDEQWDQSATKILEQAAQMLREEPHWQEIAAGRAKQIASLREEIEGLKDSWQTVVDVGNEHVKRNQALREEIADTHEQLKATVLAGRRWMEEQKKMQSERDKLRGELEEIQKAGSTIALAHGEVEAENAKLKSALEKVGILFESPLFEEVLSAEQDNKLCELVAEIQSLNPTLADAEEPKEGGECEECGAALKSSYPKRDVMENYFWYCPECSNPEGHDPTPKEEGKKS